MIRKLLAAILMLAPGVAHAEWLEARTRHFVIYADERRDHLSQFALSLERYDKAMRVFRNIPDAPVPESGRVTIYVLRSVNAIAALSGPGVMGFYIPRAGGSVAFTIRKDDTDWNSVNRTAASGEYALTPQLVLRHEYAHHFMFTGWAGGALPMWLTEGFAEFHATAMEQPDGSIVFGKMPGYRAANFAYNGACTASRLIVASDLTKLELCDVTDVYAWGWLLTDYLTFSPGGPEKMAAYLRAIQQGKPAAEAAKAFGDLGQFDKELLKQLQRKQLPAFTVPAGKLDVPPPVIRPLSAAETATIAVRMRSDAGVDEKEAPGVYRAAMQAAQPYPDDPAAQLVVAEAAYDAKQYQASEAAAHRALAAAPKSTQAMLYIGRAKRGQAVAAKSTDKAVWREVRRWFVNANRNDPDNPEPLIFFYCSFVAAGEPATANAIEGLYDAIASAPYARSINFIAAHAYLSQNRKAEARAALAVIAFNPDFPTERERASKLVEMIDAGQTAAAMDALLPWAKDPDYVEPKDKKKK